jgi:hypothetical protein
LILEFRPLPQILDICYRLYFKKSKEIDESQMIILNKKYNDDNFKAIYEEACKHND